jgi:hypothetical protein
MTGVTGRVAAGRGNNRPFIRRASMAFVTSAFRGVVPLLLSLVGGCAEEEPWAVRPPYTPPPLRDAALVTDGGTDGALTDGAGTDGPLDDGGGIDGPLDDGGIDAPSGVDASTAGCLPLGTQPIALRVLGQLCPITNLRPFQGCAPDCRHGDIPMSVPFVSSGRTNADGQFLFADTVSLPATISAGPGGPFVTTTLRREWHRQPGRGADRLHDHPRRSAGRHRPHDARR